MDPLSFEFVSVEEAKQVLDGLVPDLPEADWSEIRRALSPEELNLSAVAVKWLASLPHEVRPFELCRTYPRIGNQLAALSASPMALSAFLGELLIDKRGGRQGFPGGIALELHRLQEHLLGPSDGDAPELGLS